MSLSCDLVTKNKIICYHLLSSHILLSSLILTSKSCPVGAKHKSMLPSKFETGQIHSPEPPFGWGGREGKVIPILNNFFGSVGITKNGSNFTEFLCHLKKLNIVNNFKFFWFNKTYLFGSHHPEKRQSAHFHIPIGGVAATSNERRSQGAVWWAQNCT